MKELRHILYVDDDPSMEMLVKSVLESSGTMRVTACSNGIDFMLSAYEEKPDVIILDVMMSLLSGPELIRELNHHGDFGDIPLIFLTSRAEPEDIKRYMDMGVTGVIAKPFDLEKFPEQIKELWRKYHGI